MTAAERYERACLEYLRLAFNRFSHVTEAYRLQALQRAAKAIYAAPGGTA